MSVFRKVLFLRGFLVRGTESPSFCIKYMITKDIVKDIVVSAMKESTIFLVDVKVGNANRISVTVDKPEGITIEECANISRSIESGLNRDTEDFELEVSSPGLTEPFKVLEQYLKNCGRYVDVVKRDGQKVHGLLKYVDDNEITLEIKTKIREAGQKKAKTVLQTISIKFIDIKATRVAITL